jgi:hypothetical protein
MALTGSTSAATLCQTPPDIVPTADLTPGTTGTAWTVVKGTTPVSFDVEVLGVERDFFGPGWDFALIKTSGPVINQTGGIVAGMSGSPVYVGGDLAGSVSWGFFGADQTIGGMTPAENLIEVLNYSEDVPAAPRKLSPGLRRMYARAAAIPLEQTPAEVVPLRVPLMVSGLNGRGFKRVRQRFERGDSPFVVMKGGTAEAPTPGAPLGPPPDPGDAVGVAFSFGDFTAAGIGTATLVCNDEVVIFGHYVWHAGPTSLALTNAEILETIPDPSQLFGGFKFGTITEPTGTIFNDRFMGTAGVTGVSTSFVPITSNLEDLTNAESRSGLTESAFQQELPYIGYAHTYVNLHALTDRHTDGGAWLDVRIRGLRENGDPWVVRQMDYYDMQYDVSDVGYYAVYHPLAKLSYQDFEDITFTDVRINGWSTDDLIRATVVEVETATKLQPVFGHHETVHVKRGGRIDVRVVIRLAQDQSKQTYEFSVDIPWRVVDRAKLLVGGTAVKRHHHHHHEQRGAKSFDDLLKMLKGHLDESALFAEIVGPGKDRRVLEQVDLVVYGTEELRIRVH